MDIKETLKIGGHIVNVELISRTNIDGDALGTCKPWANRIQVSKDMPESVQAVTFLHEIIEYILLQHEITIDHPLITSLSENLYQVLKDNKLDFSK